MTAKGTEQPDCPARLAAQAELRLLLYDGTVHIGLITNGSEIRGIWDGQGSGSWEHHIPFQPEDIRRIRPHSWWPFREQILSFLAPPR